MFPGEEHKASILFWNIEALQLVYLTDSGFRIPVGSLQGKDALFLGHLKDLKEPVIDPFRLHLHPLGAVALNLIDHLDHPAGIDDIIGSIKDASLMEHPAVTFFILELIIGRACHELAF
jgi:hypothetical protein